jgi:putative ABC transport system substrate-binding protein
VFAVGDDPVKLGLVASLARPGSNATGINLLLNPANVAIAEATLRGVQEAAPTIGLQIHSLNASTSAEIDGAFDTLARERFGALLVAGDGFFTSRRVQFVTQVSSSRRL